MGGNHQKPRDFVHRYWNIPNLRHMIPRFIEQARKRYLTQQEAADRMYQNYSEMNAEFVRLSEEKARNDETERHTKRRPRK